ncbi:flippase-like domain-containing protein [Methanosarcina sp. DH2]|uniref:lysylphosphatidylglycerol synthase transmembrane domain-containing protein n=1 Tax=Methanosarcina sp. DH2 TaxID=2605639 RepID=UPI001E50B91A|nr:lysylphosphatidylglycerol synthase transmembrane domain-containing protein [Methanosarcina sp. DH2]MCC4771083.1 flippase-like domain-containing protein [Methanosarcina sp. DH2]
MNLGTLKKAAAVLLLLIAIFLVRTHWIEIVPVLEGSRRILSETRIIYVILASSAYLLSVYVFAVRWQQVLSSVGYNLKAVNLLPIMFGAAFVNNITPASRTGGESLRIIWANRSFGISYTHALITILFERLVEAIPVALLFLYVLYISPSFEKLFLLQRDILSLNSSLLVTLTLIGTGIGAWFLLRKSSFFVKKLYQDCKQLNRSFAPVLLLSCGVWGLDVIRLKLVASALSLPLSLDLIITLSVLYLILGCLPITPGGLGIVEGGLVSLLLYFGLPLASAGSFVFLERFVSYGLSSLIGFLYLFYYGGFKIWKDTKSH